MALGDKAVVALPRSQSPVPVLALVPVSTTTTVTDLNLAGAEKQQLKWWLFFPKPEVQNSSANADADTTNPPVLVNTNEGGLQLWMPMRTWGNSTPCALVCLNKRDSSYESQQREGKSIGCWHINEGYVHKEGEWCCKHWHKCKGSQILGIDIQMKRIADSTSQGQGNWWCWACEYGWKSCHCTTQGIGT